MVESPRRDPRRLLWALLSLSLPFEFKAELLLSLNDSVGGLIIQFLYGEDGIDATYMENIHLKLLNYNITELEKLYKNPNMPEEFENIKQLQNDLAIIDKDKDIESLNKTLHISEDNVFTFQFAFKKEDYKIYMQDG
jgi:hypothetical protein